MRGLLLVDIQNDFLPGGALAVPRGDEVVRVANRVSKLFRLVAATQDWHPPDHLSFATSWPGFEPGERVELAGEQQVLWPMHCVRGSLGAQFAPGLELERVGRVFFKGIDREIDSYSAFFDNGHRRSTGLYEWLRERGVDQLYLLGLATDYCVAYSARDALALGLRTYVIEDGCRAVDLQPDDGARALAELERTGATRVRSEELV